MNQKKTNETIARLNRIVDFLQQQKQSLATGDGDVRMLAAAVVYWEHWPSYLEGAVSLVVDAFGHDSDSQAKDWLWRVRSAYFDVMCESVHLIARESERENLDTTALWRGWHCLRPLLGDSSVELPILLRKENLPTSREYVLEANAVIERLGTRVDIRKAPPLDGVLRDEWPRQAKVAAGLSLSRPQIKRLIEAGELQSNGLSGHDCRVDPASVLKYCDRKGVRYDPE